MADTGNGAVATDGEAVRRYRVLAGFTVEQLAKKAGISKRTLENLQNGKPAQITTIKLVADALKVEFSRLIAEQFEPPASPPRPAKVTLNLNLTFPEFDATEQLTLFLQSLRGLIGAKDAINVVSIEDGSVILVLEMSERDWDALIKAYWIGGLEDTPITEIVSPSRKELGRFPIQYLPIHNHDGSRIIASGTYPACDYEEEGDRIRVFRLEDPEAHFFEKETGIVHPRKRHKDDSGNSA